MNEQSEFWKDLNEDLKDPEFRKQFESDFNFYQRCFRLGWVGGVAIRMRRRIQERRQR
jgi:hypothetical protein